MFSQGVIILKPIIGLTSQYEHLVGRKMIKMNNTYVNAVVDSGGVPIILPIIKSMSDVERYLDLVDGLIFTGGEDVSPIFFGEEPLKEVDTICMARDKMEIQLFLKAYEKNIPILGICRGLQVINIALGGTLYQDINVQVPNVIGHMCSYNISQGYHTISILENSIFSTIFKTDKVIVNSQHHQSIKDLGRDLKVTSTTIDGVIESIESTNDKWLLGTQFHPEVMIESDDEFMGIFNLFMGRCTLV